MSDDETPAAGRPQTPGTEKPGALGDGSPATEGTSGHNTTGASDPEEGSEGPELKPSGTPERPTEKKLPATGGLSDSGPELPPEASAPRPRPAEEPAVSKEAQEDAGSDPEQDREPAEQSETGRRRLAASLWPPRASRAQLIVAMLLFVLGLGLAIQVSSTSDSSALRGARQEDLVRILDELDDRTQRLEAEKRSLEDQRTELESSSDQAEEARKQTVEKEQQLGVLAGTVAAQGPGISITISDPKRAVKADMLLDAIQELRAAGAEAIQINDVRIVAGTYVTDTAGGVRIDKQKVSAPYRFEVIGKPQDLEPALNIPGGVVQSLEKEQAHVSVRRAEKIVVDALRSAKRPDYARSSQ